MYDPVDTSRTEEKWRTHVNRLHTGHMMISFLARQLPRTAASALSSPVTRTSPSLSTFASTPVTLLTDRPRGGETSCRIKTRGPYGALFFSRTSSSLPNENDDAVLRRDAIAEIIAAEHELKLALSKKIVAMVFDTIVEVRVKEYLILFTCLCIALSLQINRMVGTD